MTPHRGFHSVITFCVHYSPVYGAVAEAATGTWPQPGWDTRQSALRPACSLLSHPNLLVAPEQPSVWVGCGVGVGLWVPDRALGATCLPQVGEEAHFSVKSTCPCSFTLYYEVAARGNIVLSGQQPAHITQQRSRRATPEKPIRLTHLSETGEPSCRLQVLSFLLNH